MKLTFSNGSGLLNLGNGDIPVSSLDLPFQADGIFFDDFGQHYVKFIGAGHVLMTADEIAATVAYLEGLPARPSSDYELTSTGWQIPAGALETAKAAQWEIVKAARDAVIYGGFTYNGGTYDSDQISQSRIQGAVQLAAIATQSNQPFSLVWTLADNSTVTLDAPGTVALGAALGNFVQTNFATGTTLRNQINAAPDLQTVASIVWPATT